jgi:lipopolysaccharide biosynthesis protein
MRFVIVRFIAQTRKLSRFLFPGRRERGYIRKVKASGLFDAAFYVTHHPNMRWIFRRFPVRHYVTIGEREHLKPNPDFAGAIYLRYNPDVRLAGIPPFLHYVEIGHRELRVTKELPEPVPSLAKAMPRVGAAAGAADFAVVAHVFYHDLWDEIADRLEGSGLAFDLFVTVTDKGAETDALIPRIAARFPQARTLRYPNRGRDVLPFVHLVGAGVLDGYRAVCKIHTKRSPHREDGDHWRRHLMAGILPEGCTATTLARFLAWREAAVWVADGQHYRSPDWWGSNWERVAQLLARLEIRPVGELAFPAGSMYWLKPPMIAMIKALMLTPEDFDVEAAQLDGTLAHAFERALGFVVAAGGLKVVETGEIPQAAPKPRPRTRPGFVSAFYLPQFHPTPENDAWWGKGFTEWTALTRARPSFAGHVQPFLPADLGFYDLRVPETMGAQWRLASAAGIDAFCVYHYWFDGRRILEAPLDTLLARPDVPFRYYLAWANEAWRRNWDGLSGDILIDQRYGAGFEAGLAASALPHFADPRYARPDGRRPRFLIYRPTDLPDPAASVAALRAAFAAAGHDVELGAVLFHVEGEAKVAPDLFDFWVEMPPHGLVGPPDYLAGGPQPTPPELCVAGDFEGLIYDYDRVIAASRKRRFAPGLEGRVIRGVMPSWDNTARRGRAAHIAHGANPLRFAKWLGELAEHGLGRSYRGELFVNAWNEWAEKAVLEPSAQYGHGYLDALAALRN